MTGNALHIHYSRERYAANPGRPPVSPETRDASKRKVTPESAAQDLRKRVEAAFAESGTSRPSQNGIAPATSGGAAAAAAAGVVAENALDRAAAASVAQAEGASFGRRVTFCMTNSEIARHNLQAAEKQLAEVRAKGHQTLLGAYDALVAAQEKVKEMQAVMRREAEAATAAVARLPVAEAEKREAIAKELSEDEEKIRELFFRENPLLQPARKDLMRAEAEGAVAIHTDEEEAVGFFTTLMAASKADALMRQQRREMIERHAAELAEFDRTNPRASVQPAAPAKKFVAYTPAAGFSEEELAKASRDLAKEMAVLNGTTSAAAPAEVTAQRAKSRFSKRAVLLGLGLGVGAVAVTLGVMHRDQILQRMQGLAAKVLTGPAAPKLIAPINIDAMTGKLGPSTPSVVPSARALLNLDLDGGIMRVRQMVEDAAPRVLAAAPRVLAAAYSYIPERSLGDIMMKARNAVTDGLGNAAEHPVNTARFARSVLALPVTAARVVFNNAVLREANRKEAARKRKLAGDLPPLVKATAM